MKSAGITWTETGYPAAIEFSPDALERLRQHTLAGLRSVPKLGVGGLLLGIRDTGTSVLRVEGLVEVPGAHAGGPSFSLTAEELTHALGLVREPRGLSVVGWYLSRTQPPLAPRATDLNLYASLCPAPWQIMVMIRPGAAETAKGVVIFRDSSGQIASGAVRDIPEQREASGLATASPTPGPDTQAASRKAEKAGVSAARAASGANPDNRNQPEGAHGFEPVRSFQLMPEKQPVSQPVGARGLAIPSTAAPRVVGTSVFQQNPFAPPADTRGVEGPHGFEAVRANQLTRSDQPVSRPAGEGGKSVFQQNPFAPPAATRGVEGPHGFEAVRANQLTRSDQPVSVPAGESESAMPVPDVPGVVGTSVFQQNPVAPPADTRGVEGPHGFEAVRSNQLMRNKQPVSVPAGDVEIAVPTPGGLVVPPADTRQPAGPHGFEAFRPHKLIRGKQPATAPDGDEESSASPPAARVVASRPASESREPATPRRKRLVMGAVATGFLLVAWATSSLWLGSPLRLELTEAGGHITAIWNTDGVTRGVAGSLLVTDSGKTVTIPLSPEKVITGVAGYNVKSGKISATLKIGDQQAKAEWRAPDNWAPPASVELNPGELNPGEPNSGADQKPKP